MPVIAVVNRKGGSGKSTLATHLAAHFAHAGAQVLLGDADFQQSSHAWLRLRDTQTLAKVPRIAGWAVDPKHVQRAPQGFTHVVLDTPGGLEGYQLLRIVTLADALLVPVGASMFDRESAAQCVAELQAHPRVKQGRCVLAAVGMRLDARTRAAALLERWASQREMRFLGALRETQTYVKCLEHGLTIFDMPAARVAADRAQWQPLLDWLGPLEQAAPHAEAPSPQRTSRPVLPAGSAPAGQLRPPAATQSPSAATIRVSGPTKPRADTGMAARIGRWFSALTPRREG